MALFSYDDLEWFVMFPLACAIMMWFSIDLALLVRVAGGRRRRKEARTAIEKLVLQAPATLNRTEGSGFGGGGGIAAPSSSSSPLQQQQPAARQKRYVKSVVIPVRMRIATMAVARRAVVCVGGDFARSPRMQYHAASLAESGLFDEIVLVGLDYGNSLSEALYSCGGSPDPESFHLDSPESAAEVQTAVWERFRRRLQDRRARPRTGCVISVRYLAEAPKPPKWFQVVFPVLRLHWAACALYRAAAFTLLFSWLLVRATALRVNQHGQLLLTDLIVVQTPPAVPFVLIIKYIVRPLCSVYGAALYYFFIVPASWFNSASLREIRQQAVSQRHPLFSHSDDSSRSVTTPTSPVSPAGSSRSRSSGGLRSPSITHNQHQQKQQQQVALRRWWRAGRLRGSVFWPALVVDWHNFGYTILQAARRPTFITDAYRLLEMHLCAGDVNVTVSHAMKRYLLGERIVPREFDPTVEEGCGAGSGGGGGGVGAGTVVVVLYDVAPSFFQLTTRRAFVAEVVAPATRLSLRPMLADVADYSDSNNDDVGGGGGSSVDDDDGDSDSGVGDGVAPQQQQQHKAAGAGATTDESADGSDGTWGISHPPAWVSQDLCGSGNGVGNNSSFGINGNGTGIAGVNTAAAAAARSSFSAAGATRRGIIIVGSTSWTDDDDYSILIEALQRIDHRLKHEHLYLNSNNSGGGGGSRGGPVSPTMATTTTTTTAAAAAAMGQHPFPHHNNHQQQQLMDVWVLITGKGPARRRFESAVLSARLSSHVVVSTLYMQSFKQYSTTLGAADVGLCLHFSSSGLDLPMKAVDMVGCGLPVMALDYPAIGELMGGAVAGVGVGGVVLPRSPPTSSDSGRSLNHHHPNLRGCPVECERGWLFSTAAELEKLIGSFIGLDALDTGRGGGAVSPRSRSVGGGAGAPLAAVIGSPVPGGLGLSPPLASPADFLSHGLGPRSPAPPPPLGTGVVGGSPTSVSAAAAVCGGGAAAVSAGFTPSPLWAMQRKTRAAPRSTWEENWNANIKPIIVEIV